MRSPNTILLETQRPVRTLLSVFLTSALLTLGACSGAPPAQQPVIAPAQPVPLPQVFQPLPLPAPVQRLPVKWLVVTPKRLPVGQNWVLFALTAKDYENLSRTNADIIRWMTEATFQLKRGQVVENKP